MLNCLFLSYICFSWLSTDKGESTKSLHFGLMHYTQTFSMLCSSIIDIKREEFTYWILNSHYRNESGKGKLNHLAIKFSMENSAGAQGSQMRTPTPTPNTIPKWKAGWTVNCSFSVECRYLFSSFSISARLNKIMQSLARCVFLITVLNGRNLQR